MGLLGSVSTDSMSQQQGTSNNHGGLPRAMPGEPRTQGLPLSVMQSGRAEAQVSNPGMHQILIPNKQSPQQLSTTPKRKAPMELSSSNSVMSNKRVAQMGHRPWLQQASNASIKGSSQMQSLSNASRPQHSAASSKRKTQMDTSSNKSGTPRSVNSKSQNTQIKQSSKVQAESSESVRSKMRESLAAALALVSQQDKPPSSSNNTLTDAVNTQGKLDNSSQCAGSASASINTALEQRQDISQSVNSTFAVAGSIDHVAGEGKRNVMLDGGFSEKCKDYEVGSTDVSNSDNILSSMPVFNCDKQDFQSGYTLTTDDVPFSDSFFCER